MKCMKGLIREYLLRTVRMIGSRRRWELLALYEGGARESVANE